LHCWYGKGIPNGVNHEKKGNKRAANDERLVFLSLTELGFQPVPLLQSSIFVQNKKLIIITRRIIMMMMMITKLEKWCNEGI
jgi:hypothetical protein